MQLSGKVKWPAVALVAIGAVILIVWVALGLDAGHPLFVIALSVLGAAGIQLPVGYQAPHRK